MSYTFYVFCRKMEAPNRRAIATFIEDGAFFDEKPQFDPSPDVSESNIADWDRLTIVYDKERQPVVIQRHIRAGPPQKEMDELLFILDRSSKTKAQQRVHETLKGTKLVFTLDCVREEVTKDCWEMLDAVESFLARECDGLVHAPPQDFFDNKLKRIYRL